MISGANVRYAALREAERNVGLGVSFIPGSPSDGDNQLRGWVTCNGVFRRIGSLFLQLALIDKICVFDSTPHLPFKQHCLLVHDHGNLFPNARRSNYVRSLLFRLQILFFTECVVTVSNTIRRFLKKSGYAGNVIIAPNSVSVDPVKGGRLRTIDFLFVTSGAHHKRDLPMYLALRSAFPDSIIAFAGSGLQKKLGLKASRKTLFFEEPGKEELGELYSRAQIYVTWSRVEGFGMTVDEALRHGCRCLITNIPVFRELYSRYPQVSYLNTKKLKQEEIINARHSVESTVPNQFEPLSWESILVDLTSDLN